MPRLPMGFTTNVEGFATTANCFAAAVEGAATVVEGYTASFEIHTMPATFKPHLPKAALWLLGLTPQLWRATL